MPNHSVARLNDTGSHNGADRGTITTSAKRTYLNDSLPARVGDTYLCPKHGANAIRTGSAKVWVESRRLARVGSKTWCGATIDTGAHNVTDGSAEIDPFADPSCAPGGFDVSCIPSVMYNENWDHAAELLVQWFSRKASRDKSANPPNTTTVTMDWVLSDTGSTLIYDQMIQDRIWMNGPAQVAICALLDRKGLLAGAGGTFGDLSLSAPLLDPDHIQHRKVDRSFGPDDVLDGNFKPVDIQAALAQFQFHMAVSGHVSRLPQGGHLVRLSAIGVYVVDNYDFEDESGVLSQYLGGWDCTGQRFNVILGHPVFNSDFDDWRNRMGFGADYFVYSDVRVTQLDPDANSFVC